MGLKNQIKQKIRGKRLGEEYFKKVALPSPTSHSKIQMLEKNPNTGDEIDIHFPWTLKASHSAQLHQNNQIALQISFVFLSDSSSRILLEFM